MCLFEKAVFTMADEGWDSSGVKFHFGIEHVGAIFAELHL
jgi:hypothetical protein